MAICEAMPKLRMEIATVRDDRKRLYWTNIAEIPQPIDRGIFIRDILEDEVDEKYYISDKAIQGMINHTEKKYGEGK